MTKRKVSSSYSFVLNDKSQFALSIERTPMKVVDIFPHSGKANKIFPDSDKGKEKRLKSDFVSLD